MPLYSAGFDIARLPLGDITLKAAGETDVVVTMSSIIGVTRLLAASTKMFHAATNNYVALNNRSDTPAYVLDDWDVTGFALALQSALRTEANSVGWTAPNSIVCVFDHNNGTASFPVERPFGYVIAHLSHATSVEWTTTYGAQFMGFSGNSASASTHVSNQAPLFCISPTQPGVEASELREPRKIVSHAFPDSGRGLGASIRRHGSPLYIDFRQVYEYAWKVRAHEALTTHPYTFEHLFDYARCEWPFLCYQLLPRLSVDFGSGLDTSNAYLLLLREDGSSWDPERAAPGFSLQSHVPFACHVIGAAQIS